MPYVSISYCWIHDKSFYRPHQFISAGSEVLQLATLGIEKMRVKNINHGAVMNRTQRT